MIVHCGILRIKTVGHEMKKLQIPSIIFFSLLFAHCEKRHAGLGVHTTPEVASALDYAEGTAFCSEVYTYYSSKPKDSEIIRTLPEEIDLTSDQQLLQFGSTLLHFEEAQLQVTRTDMLTIIHYRPLKQEHVYRCFGDSVIIKTSVRNYATIQMSRS